MSVLDAAFGYVDRSNPWPLFPASPTNKLPLIRTGVDHAEHASIEIETVRQWFGVQFPDAAIGMPTGAASGTIVLDFDKKHDGEVRCAELEEALGALSRERAVRTQNGGLHLYFRHPGPSVRVRTGQGPNSALGKLLGGVAGVDVRADGGIVLLPPSKGYRWIADEEGPLPELPKRWLLAIQGAGEKPQPLPVIRERKEGETRWCAPERVGAISEGGRNAKLFERGVALRIAGATKAEILEDLEQVNALRCSPSLSKREVARIAASAAGSRRAS